MEQLVQPNLSVIGYPDFCLAYVGEVFGLASENTPDAWLGWLSTQFKHTGPIPNLSVPVWFSWTGTIGGVTQNWGHVAVSTPSGVYTNPLSGSGHKVFPSVPALEQAYGVKYVGWSEDISNLKVIGDNMQPQIDELNTQLDNTNKALDGEIAARTALEGQLNTTNKALDTLTTRVAKLEQGPPVSDGTYQLKKIA